MYCPLWVSGRVILALAPLGVARLKGSAAWENYMENYTWMCYQ